MYVLPDPFTTAYDVAAVEAQAADPTFAAAVAEVEGVSAFGTMAVTVTQMAAEEANDFAADPAVTATTSAAAVTITGATTGEGYVLCWMEKEGTSTAPVEEAAARLLQDAEAEATEDATADAEATDDTAEATTEEATTETAAADDHDHDHDEMHEEDYYWQQAQTSGETLDFSIAFASLEGMVYEWGCVATSNNPVNPEHTSDAVWGSATTPDPVVEDTGAAYLWSTMIMAIFLAVFMF